MREDLKYPRVDAIDSVLRKIGVDPDSRYDEFDQDFEYTTCRLEELEKYLDLYSSSETSDNEKRVLGCYFLECLNEYIQDKGYAHKLQNQAFEILYQDIEIHESELLIWSDTSDRNQENWWPITNELVKWHKT